MAIKKSLWRMILKVAVAVVTAIAGVLGVNYTYYYTMHRCIAGMCTRQLLCCDA